MSKHVSQIIPLHESPLHPGDDRKMVVGLALVDHGNLKGGTGVELIVRDMKTGFVHITEGYYRGFQHIEDEEENENVR